MTQPQLAFDPVSPDADTFTGRVAHLFLAHPGEWINALDIARIGGMMAWRTRISDARHEYGLKIENRVRRVGKVKVSEYRLEP